MHQRLGFITLQPFLLPLMLLTVAALVDGQSCGPRFSARLLADIPCDMSKTGYCSVPGGAYPWQSVKRYIFDNQGLVRRMYGEERHNSVISKEMTDHRMRYNAHFLDSDAIIRFGRSRSIKGRTKPSRRQSRPQKFVEEPTEVALTHSSGLTTNPTPTDETIFRVVTETSVKIGGETTATLPSRTTTSKPMPFLTQMHPTVYDIVSNDSTLLNFYDGSTTSKFTLMANNSETTSVFTTMPTTNVEPETSVESEDEEFISISTISDDKTTLPEGQPPIALQRVSFDEDYDEYDDMPKKKFSAFPQNSVEEKIKDKDYVEDMEEEDDGEKSKNEDVEDLVMEESERGEELGENENKEETEESVPRRGINACPVKNEVIAPYWANNTRGETLALLNVYPFEQYVHFEKCAFENHQMLCREGCRCEQQYRLHRLLAFDPRNECRGIFSDWFRFPSCCVCICYDLTPDLPKSRTRTARLK